MVGTTVSHYTILEKLGEGGMGVVYKAEDTRLKRVVALKFLPQSLSAHEPERARFLQEAQAAAALNHPHICAIYSIGEEGEQQYIEMEFVDGVTLRRMIEDGKLRIEDGIGYAIQIAEALQEAHCHGIVHRDIKADNIMVNSKNQVKVMDFGLAKLKGSLHLTKTSSTIGTLAYMAPEQIEGGEVDARSDIFSFGIVLYEMLTGHLPFRGEHEAAMMYSIVNEEPTPILKYLPEISSELQHILSRALEKDPEDRYQHVDDMASELRRLKKTTSKVTRVEMPSQSPIAPTRSISARRGGFLSLRSTKAAIIIAALLIIAGVSYFLFFPSATKLVENRVAVALFENQTGDPSLEPYGVLMSESVAQGLAGIGVVEAVPSSDALRIWQQMNSGSERENAMAAFVKESGAKLVVKGAYYKQGDSLLIHALVTDTETGKNVKVMQPVGVATEKRIQAIGQVRQRMLGAVAFALDKWSSSLYGIVPTYFPTFDAYREFRTGMDIFLKGNWAGSIDHLQKATEIDPTFKAPLAWAAVAYFNTGNFGVADSITQSLDELRPTLEGMDLDMLNNMQAILRGNNLACLEVSRESSRRYPGVAIIMYEWARSALSNNRPHEARTAFSQMDRLDSTLFRDWPLKWRAKTDALHFLGEHEQEIAEAKKARQEFPDNIAMIGFEMRALGAMGRVDDIWKRFEEACAVPQRGWTAAGIMLWCAGELRYHGFMEASRQAADKAINWYLSRSDSEQQAEGRQAELARSYYIAERFADAQKIYRKLLQQHPDNIDYQGTIGAIAARLGDTTEARRIDAVLKGINQPYLFGGHTYYRACIAALLGEKEHAVSFLRDALSQGQEYYRLHADIDLETLRDYPPFQDLVKPKD